MDFLTLEHETTMLSEMVGTNYPVTWHHIPEEQTLQALGCSAVLLYRHYVIG
jgi:hypothetical protein